MGEREIRKMRRPELVEMVENLLAEQETMKLELAVAKERLQDRRIAIEESGSLAEAVCRVNGIMEAADAAAEQYLENARSQCETMITNAKNEAQAYWDEVYMRLQEYCKASDALKEVATLPDVASMA